MRLLNRQTMTTEADDGHGGRSPEWMVLAFIGVMFIVYHEEGKVCF
jgi:hypothetical protein